LRKVLSKTTSLVSYSSKITPGFIQQRRRRSGLNLMGFGLLNGLHIHQILNPIEHVWNMLKRTLLKLHPFLFEEGRAQTNWKNFHEAIQEAWWAIP
jgi:hypothetical protein